MARYVQFIYIQKPGTGFTSISQAALPKKFKGGGISHKVVELEFLGS